MKTGRMMFHRPSSAAVSAFALALALALGCRAKSELPARVEAEQAPSIVDTSFRYPDAERIVAIGDLHGDIRATRAALRLAGALSEDGHWAGGKLVVVQTGDQLDRGDDEPEVLDLLELLEGEAKAAGGAVYVLNGNHEVMNVQGDFRYVTPDGFRDYSNTPDDGLHRPEVHGLPSEQRGRASAFLSGEIVAKRLAKRSSLIQVGKNVFVHGGLLKAHVRLGLGRINREVQEWMLSGASRPAPSIARDERGPFWLRIYSDGVPTSGACEELDGVLDWLSAKRLVVGHTVQRQGINSACDGRVWRIDVGLARAYGGSLSVLEIKGAETRVITVRGDEAVSP